MSVASEALERSEGTLRLGFQALGEHTRIRELYQSGCLKARLPRRTTRAAEAICINTSGGLTDGYALESTIDCDAGSIAIATSQAAERVYRARGAGLSRVTTTLSVGDDAVLAWLPQETILFDGGRLVRSLDVSLASSSTLVAVETGVIGRTAMGERVKTGLLQDEWSIRIDGQLEFVDRTRLDGPNLGALGARPAVLGGAISFATIVYAHARCGSLLEPVRDRIGISGALHGGATVFGKLLVARLAAHDAASLRQTVASILETIASAHPSVYLPKVWSL